MYIDPPQKQELGVIKNFKCFSAAVQLLKVRLCYFGWTVSTLATSVKYGINVNVKVAKGSAEESH